MESINGVTIWHEPVFVMSRKKKDGQLDHEKSKVFDKNGYYWIVDEQFYKLELPNNPFKWNQKQVLKWMNWAIKEYDLMDVFLINVGFDGKQLFSEDFCWDKVGLGNNSTTTDFWTHVSLLKILNRGYIKDKNKEHIDLPTLLQYKNELDLNPDFNRDIEIWRFLLSLLTDKKYKNVIEWIDNEGTFKIIKPNTVSMMWGLVKYNCTMSYNKVASSLRYHYGKGIIERTKGKYLYKFVCDIKSIIGYSPMELKNMFQQEFN